MSVEDARETIRFAILNELVTNMPVAAHPFLEQAALVAANALKAPETQWVFSVLAPEPKKFWVLMGNDFPDGVYTDEAQANAACEKKKAEDLAKRPKDEFAGTGYYRIYWRLTEFNAIPLSAPVAQSDRAGDF